MTQKETKQMKGELAKLMCTVCATQTHSRSPVSSSSFIWTRLSKPLLGAANCTQGERGQRCLSFRRDRGCCKLIPDHYFLRYFCRPAERSELLPQLPKRPQVLQPPGLSVLMSDVPGKDHEGPSPLILVQPILRGSFQLLSGLLKFSTYYIPDSF